MKKCFAILLLVSGCSGCKKKCPEVTPNLPDPAITANISGTVFFEGEVKPEEPVAMAGGAECQAMNKTSPAYPGKIVAAGGRLKNVFVYIKSGLDPKYVWAPPKEPVVIDQQKCMFAPRVSGAMVCQPIELRNGDPVNHNVSNDYWNVGLSIQGAKSTEYFHEPRVMIRLKCNVHDWMTGYIGVVPHPHFQVTGDDGTFSFKGVPEGDYVIEAWHESLGAQTANVSLKRKVDKTDLKFTFSLK